MSTVDDGSSLPILRPEPAARQAAATRAESWSIKARLREQSKVNRALGRELAEAREELAEARRRIARLDPVDFGGLPEPEPAEQPGQPPADPDTAPAPDHAGAAELRRQVAETQARAAELERQPVGIPPEHQRAAQLVSQAAAGASPPTEGLEGMYARLQDRSVPWPQLQQEMAAMGWRDPVSAATWDGSTP